MFMQPHNYYVNYTLRVHSFLLVIFREHCGFIILRQYHVADASLIRCDG